MATSNTGTGRFAFLRQLIADGIRCIFGNPGSSEENLLDALSSPEFAGQCHFFWRCTRGRRSRSPTPAGVPHRPSSTTATRSPGDGRPLSSSTPMEVS